MALDWLREHGHDDIADLFAHQQKPNRKGEDVGHWVIAFCRSMEFQAVLDRFDPAEVVTVHTGRGLSLKERANLCRALFRSWCLPHVRVYLPTGRNSHWVHVDYPKVFHLAIRDVQLEQRTDYKVEHQILFRAFPDYTDESDYQSDYFAPSWYVRGAMPMHKTTSPF